MADLPDNKPTQYWGKLYCPTKNGGKKFKGSLQAIYSFCFYFWFYCPTKNDCKKFNASLQAIP